jgi:hypothetical protein
MAALMLALGLTLAGCPEGGPTDPDPSLRLELGTGQQQFTPLADGETLLLRQGCQGSQHIFVSLRAWGLPPNPVMVDLSLTRTEDEQRVSPAYRVRYLFAQGTGEAPDELPGLLFQLTQPAQAIGRTVRLTASVETDDGQIAEDSHTGPLEWGPIACP